MDGLSSCVIEGCEKPRRSTNAEWCNTHYFRNRRNGSPTRLVYEEKRSQVCRVDGCERSVRNGGWGWCKAHYVRWWRHGDPLILRSHPWSRGDDVNYRGLHIRIASARGKASAQVCVDCGKAAEQWAYDHTDPDPKVSEHGSPFSLDIRRYQPMCRSCHGVRDWAHR